MRRFDGDRLRPFPRVSSDAGDELAHGISEVVDPAERLGQEAQGVVANEVRVLFVQATGEEDDALLELGPQEPDPAKELDATELRHLDVADDRVEPLAIREAPERGRGRQARIDAQAGTLEEPRVSPRHGRFVVDQEHGRLERHEVGHDELTPQGAAS